MDEWQDIAIVDLDDGLSERIEPNKAMFRFYFKLSAAAPELWQELFEQTRKFPRHSLWRTAWPESEHIVLECPAETLEMHKADLDEDVANTNAEYRKHLKQTTQQERKAAAQATDDRGLLRDWRKKLFG